MDYRSMNESCQCPRCRCEIRLPSQPMPCPEKCSPEKYMMCGSEQRPRWQKRPGPQEVFQNFSQRNSQTLSQESAQNWSFQPPPNCFCGQQTSMRAQPDYSQQFSQEYSQQFLPNLTQQCSQQAPCISCCGQQKHQNCCQSPCANWMRPCCRITHEIGVQTDEMECEIKPEYIAITDITTKELEVKHRTGKTETIIERVQSVTHFPVTDTQFLGENGQIDKAMEDDVVPNRAMRNSELEPMLDSIRAKVPKSEHNSGKEQLVYQEYAKSERDFNDPKAKVEKTIVKLKTPLDSPESLSKSRSPSNISSPSRVPSEDDFDDPKATVEKTIIKDKSPLDSPEPPSRMPNEDKAHPSLPRVISSISAEDPSVVKDEDGSNSTDIDVNDHKESIEKEKKVVHSESDNVSTVHVKVTNRKEASVKSHPDREPTKTAIFESSVSQVLVKKHEKKPEEKKPKRPPPKVELKLGYPPNDLVCRYADPPACRPTCGSTRCPCPPSISCNQCPPCPPSTRQCDPIYGFGSMCVGYYCL
ncbi:uncharacterized protein Dere_GG20047 [Drosophila erecta]|uniref:Uncharacterized protein n=1 Tax=Drosophila erecta TaxID=7220 RepID=B3NPB3_DROER|nr:uncharacterized protein Dere_GG20047 [Drosophila erecta]